MNSATYCYGFNKIRFDIANIVCQQKHINSFPPVAIIVVYVYGHNSDITPPPRRPTSCYSITRWHYANNEPVLPQLLYLMSANNKDKTHTKEIIIILKPNNNKQNSVIIT